METKKMSLWQNDNAKKYIHCTMTGGAPTS